MERQRPPLPMRIIQNMRLEHAKNTGNLELTVKISKALGRDELDQGMDLIEAYGVLAFRAQREGQQDLAVSYWKTINEIWSSMATNLTTTS